MPALFRFNTEQKIGLFFMFAIYSLLILSGFLMTIIGFYAIIIAVVPFPMMQITLFAYRLHRYKQIHSEVEGYKWLIGWIIDSKGNVHEKQLAIYDSEEISVTDMDIQNFENSDTFKKFIQESKEQNGNIQSYISSFDIKEDTLPSMEIEQYYEPLGLVTSKQIYFYELIRRFNKDENFLKDINNTLKNMDSTKYGETTNYLKGQLGTFKLDESTIQKILTTEAEYSNKSISLKSIFAINKNNDKITNVIHTNKLMKKMFIVLIVFSILSFISISEIAKYFGIISMIITVIGLMLISVKLFKHLNENMDLIITPEKIIIQNEISPSLRTDSFCSLRKHINNFTPDKRLYKFTPYQDELGAEKGIFGRSWNSDYIYMVLPTGWGDSLQFDVGYIGHKGEAVRAQTAPIIMLEIGKIFKEPIYDVIGCNYIFKTVTKVFHNYNLQINYEKMAFIRIISDLEADNNIMKPRIVALERRAAKWKEHGSILSQIQINDSIDRREDMIDVSPQSTAMYRQQQESQDQARRIQMRNQKIYELQQKKKKKKIALIIFSIFIVLTILIIWLISTPVQTEPLPSETSDETVTTMLRCLNAAKIYR